MIGVFNQFQCFLNIDILLKIKLRSLRLQPMKSITMLLQSRLVAHVMIKRSQPIGIILCMTNGIMLESMTTLRTFV